MVSIVDNKISLCNSVLNCIIDECDELIPAINKEFHNEIENIKDATKEIINELNKNIGGGPGDSTRNPSDDSLLEQTLLAIQKRLTIFKPLKI